MTCPKSKPWSENEMEILVSNYDSLSVAEIAGLLPGRKVSAIYNKARKLGLSRNYGAYTKAELKILRETSLSKDLRAIARRLPNRTIQSIRSKRSVLGYTTGTRRRWERAEDKIILANPGKSASSIKKLLEDSGYERTVAAVNSRRRELQIEKVTADG